MADGSGSPVGIVGCGARDENTPQVNMQTTEPAAGEPAGAPAPVLLLYDVRYAHAIPALLESLEEDYTRRSGGASCVGMRGLVVGYPTPQEYSPPGTSGGSTVRASAAGDERGTNTETVPSSCKGSRGGSVGPGCGCGPAAATTGVAATSAAVTEGAAADTTATDDDGVAARINELRVSGSRCGPHDKGSVSTTRTGCVSGGSCREAGGETEEGAADERCVSDSSDDKLLRLKAPCCASGAGVKSMATDGGCGHPRIQKQQQQQRDENEATLLSAPPKIPPSATTSATRQEQQQEPENTAGSLPSSGTSPSAAISATEQQQQPTENVAVLSSASESPAGAPPHPTSTRNFVQANTPPKIETPVAPTAPPGISVRIGGLGVEVESEESLKGYTVFFVGSEGRQLTNILLRCAGCRDRLRYDPSLPKGRRLAAETGRGNRDLMRRCVCVYVCLCVCVIGCRSVSPVQGHAPGDQERVYGSSFKWMELVDSNLESLRCECSYFLPIFSHVFWLVPILRKV